MRRIEIDLRKHWHTLWVVPPQKKLEEKLRYPAGWATYAFFRKSSADEDYKADHGNSWAMHTWRLLPHKAVLFSQTAPGAVCVLIKNAPISMWVLFDLDNGNPDEVHSRAYIFMFETREAARQYREALNSERARGFYRIEVTAPVKYYQQPMKA